MYVVSEFESRGLRQPGMTVRISYTRKVIRANYHVSNMMCSRFGTEKDWKLVKPFQKAKSVILLPLSIMEMREALTLGLRWIVTIRGSHII